MTMTHGVVETVQCRGRDLNNPHVGNSAVYRIAWYDGRRYVNYPSVECPKTSVPSNWRLVNMTECVLIITLCIAALFL